MRAQGDEATVVGDGPVLEADRLSTWFLTHRGMVHAVDDVSFALAAGETLGVVGESGSGKSVLARSIMGILPSNAYTAGRVRFRGRDLLGLDRREAAAVWGAQIAMVFQDPATALNPVTRIGRQLTEALALHGGLRGAAARARAIELLRLVGVPEAKSRLRAYPHQLSGGMRQRVCIAIAISCAPQLLLADEPTTALDVTIQRQILDLLTELQRNQGMGMILITHDLGVVAGRADRIAVMYAGQIVEIGASAALFDRTRHPYTASLLASIPRISDPSGTRLSTMPGRPVTVLDPPAGCRFARRCASAQERCMVEDPPLTTDGCDGNHMHRCFFPIGTPAGAEALHRNAAAKVTAAGLPVGAEHAVPRDRAS